MIKLPSKLNLPDLIREANRLAYTEDGSKTYMAYGQSCGLPDNPILRAAADEIAALRGHAALHLMVNKQPAGVVLPWHIDYLAPSPLQGALPRLERWHLPLVTNTLTSWQDCDHTDLFMQVGYWWGWVKYWKNHRFVNYGGEARVHLIVDLDTPNALGEYE